MDADSGQFLIDLERTARELEAAGAYNAGKLLRGAAFSTRVRRTNATGVPASPDEADRMLGEAIQVLARAGASPELLQALERSRQAARENRTIAHEESPDLRVCRRCGEIALGEAPDRCPACGADGLTMREFLPIYYLEPLEPQTALAALASAPAELAATMAGLSKEQLTASPEPGGWTLREAAAHLLDAQGLLAGRVEKILAEEHPSLEGAATWAEVGGESLTAAEVLEQYRRSREATVARLEAIAPQDWLRTAWHTEFGRVTLLQQASYFAKHERDHFWQICAIRQAVE